MEGGMLEKKDEWILPTFKKHNSKNVWGKEEVIV